MKNAFEKLEKHLVDRFLDLDRQRRKWRSRLALLAIVPVSLIGVFFFDRVTPGEWAAFSWCWKHAGNPDA